MALSAERVAESLANLVAYLGEEAAGQRGASYAASGRVHKITWTSPDAFEASVQGSRPRPQRVSVHFAEADYQDSECSCPMISDCEHVAAAVLRIAGEAFVQGYTWALAVEEFLPRAWRRSGLAKLPPVEGGILGPLAALPREDAAAPLVPTTAVAAVQAPRARQEPAEEVPTPEQTGPWWRQYLNAPDRTRANAIMAEAYKKHAFGGHTSWYTETLPPVLAREDNRLDALARYEQEVNHAVRYYGRSKRYDDPELRAFLESEEAHTLREAQARRVHEQNFFAWLDASAGHPANSARVVAEWRAFPQGDGIPVLCYQLLVSSRKLQRAPRQATAIKSLSDDLRAGRRNMPDAEARLVHWLAARLNVHPDGFAPDAKETFIPYVVTEALEWLTCWAPAGLLEWDTGEKVQFELTPGKLVLRPAGDGQLEWRIAIPEPGGTREVPVRGAQLLREHTKGSTAYYPANRQDRAPALLLREGAAIRYVDSASMPAEVLDAIHHLGVLPADRLRDTGAGARLAQKLGLQCDAADADICHFVPVRPRVELRLDEDKQLTLKVTAQTADATSFNRLPEGDWIVAPREAGTDETLDKIVLPGEETVAIDAAPAPAPSVITAAPRPQDVAALDAWLAQLIPAKAETISFPDRLVGLSWRVTANAFRDLATLWAVRPRGVEYLGNKAVVDLLTTRRVPRFKMKIEASGMDWLTVSIKLEEEMQFLSYEEVMAALSRTQERLVQLSGGRYFAREDLEEYREKLDLLAKMGLEVDGGEQRVHAMQLAGDAAQRLLGADAAAPDMAQLTQRARHMVEQFKGIPAVKFDARLRSVLRPYQQAGAEFLVWACKNLGGALLADDMGLGKTLQTLAALTALRARTAKNRRPALVVCPASVAHNWQREAARFAPWLKTVVIERGAERKALLANAGDYDLVIKNYALARRDIEDLSAHEWLAVVVDEAQAIKNPQSEIARTVKSLRAQYRIALTGTPIENRLSDLWSIMDFCVPGYFGTLTHFEASARARGVLLTGQLLRNRLRPLLLRRMKAEVAPELPPRVEERLDCELTPAQRKTYLAELKRTRLLLEQLPGEKADKGPGRIRILAALTRLRQICCDPALVGFPEDGAGKVEVLLELLPPLFESGHKVLVFSQFVKMLDRLRPRLKEIGVPLFTLTGATTGRQELVEAFEAAPAPAVFLISLKAGGTGLNLTSASHVVLFDPWWNPAVEAQAIDRTHRIGQDKTVVAFRLVAAGTIEERILDLQARKQSLVRDVLESDAFNRTLTRDDIEFLLRGDG